MNSKPLFKYNLSNFRAEDYRHIHSNKESIHYIDNEDDFYAEFGYTEKTKKLGFTPDEFIWSEYIKDGKSRPKCLQIPIIKYLHKHSTEFRNRFGDKYQSWILAHEVKCEQARENCPNCSLKKLFLMRENRGNDLAPVNRTS